MTRFTGLIAVAALCAAVKANASNTFQDTATSPSPLPRGTVVQVPGANNAPFTQNGVTPGQPASIGGGGMNVPAGGGATIWDNGAADGINGYSNVTVNAFGFRRTLLDDFNLPSGGTVGCVEWTHVHGNGEPAGFGTNAEFDLWTDAGGSPGQLFATATVTSYTEVETGAVLFTRPEIASTALIDPIALGAGTYWIEGTVVAPGNNFWLTSGNGTPQLSECWVNYDDLGGLQPGSANFGVPADLNFQLFGDGPPPPSSCSDLLLVDNGFADGVNGYSNIASPAGSGLRRTVLDDFSVPAGNTQHFTCMSWTHVHGNGEPGGLGIGAEFDFRNDAGGTPGGTFATATVLAYSESETGGVFFSRPEISSVASFDSISLGEGTYWWEGTIVNQGFANNFWLTSAQQGNECWVNYEDLGGLQSGTAQFGVAADMNFQLFGPCTLKKDDHFEPNDSCDTATLLGEGVFGDLALLDLSPDWYGIEVPAGETLAIRAPLGMNNPAQMLLFSSCGGALLDSDLSGSLHPEVSWRNDTGEAQMVYVELLLPGAGHCNTYNLEVEIEMLMWDRGILDAQLMAVPSLGISVMNLELSFLTSAQAPSGLDLSVRVQVAIDGQPAFDDIISVQDGGSSDGCLPMGSCTESFPCGLINKGEWWVEGGEGEVFTTWQKKCFKWPGMGDACTCQLHYPIPVYLPWAVYAGANIDVEISPAPGSASDLLTQNDRFSFTYTCGGTYSYCDPADPSSTGVPGRLWITTCDLTLGELTATGYDLPANQSGYLLIGDGTTPFQPPGASGHLCLTGGSVMGRYSQDVASTGFNGKLVTDLLNSKSGGPGGGLPSPLGGNLTAGSTWNFQYWFRDGTSSNFTNAVSVTFE